MIGKTQPLKGDIKEVVTNTLKLVLLVLSMSFLAGCNIASGTNSRVAQGIGDNPKVAGDQQDVPSQAQLQKEVELANERAKLAEERAEFEKQKREYVEGQLKTLREDETTAENREADTSVERPSRSSRSYGESHHAGSAETDCEDEATEDCECVCPIDEGDGG